MKKLAPAFLAALIVLGTACLPHSAAQTGTDKNQDSSLKNSADAVKNALLTGTAEEFFEAFAPWLQGRAGLFREDFMQQLDDMMLEGQKREEGEKKFLEHINKLDPAGKLSVKSVDDFMQLSAAKQAALWSKFYVVRNTSAGEAKWFEVHREVTTRAMTKGETKQVGLVRYLSAKHHDSIEIEATRLDSRWHVVGLRAKIGKISIDSEETPFSSKVANPDALRGNTRDARRAEGEQLMGFAKGMARVHYAKTAVTPASLSAISKADKSDFEGKYFSIRDTIYRKPDMVRGAVVAEPANEGDGWGVLYFDYGGGNDDFKWYDTEDELDEALKNFQTAK